MKKLLKMATLLSLLVMAVSCHGKRDYPEEGDTTYSLTLRATPATIDADGVDCSTLTAMYGAENVTSKAHYKIVTTPQEAFVGDYTLSGNTFTTTVAGTYKIRAEYDGTQSSTVTITAKEVGGSDTPDVPTQQGSAYARHSCVFEFTGAWCSYCPDGYVFLKYLIEDYFNVNRVHIIAFHDKTSGNDPMGVPLTNELHSKYGLSVFPGFVIDMREATAEKNDLQKMLNNTFNNYPCHCGVRVETTYTPSSRECVVKVDVKAEKSDTYRVAIFVVENKIISPQHRNGLYINDYEHNHVFRTLGSQSAAGDRLGDLAAGESGSLTRSVTIDEDWAIENCRVCVAVIGSNGFVNNAAECNVQNGLADYDLAK